MNNYPEIYQALNYAGNLVNTSVLSVGLGPKALRRSWEGNVDIKGKSNSE
jgi:hypothetical protein